jgi:RES domain-containing protein
MAVSRFFSGLGDASRTVGDRWLQHRTSVGRRVPSVVVPDRWNDVINPAHPAFADRLSHEEPAPLALDPRIRKRLS